MRLTLNIDNYSHQIDTTDPELLGKWMEEIFARASSTAGFSNATYITAQVFPSYVPDSSVPSGGRMDWIADTRIIGGLFEISSPRDFVAALSKQLDDAEALHDQDARA
jgi:hypothetical protein